MTEQAMREVFEDRMQLDVMQAGKHAEGWYLDRTVSAAWAGWTEAMQWAAEGQKPFGFITEESVWRLENGGNNKGAVPIHKHPSNTARMPLYAAPVPNADLLAEVERLRKALSFYADETRYCGPNTPLREPDEFTEDAGLEAYRLDVTRDHGSIARAALAKGA